MRSRDRQEVLKDVVALIFAYYLPHIRKVSIVSSRFHLISLALRKEIIEELSKPLNA